MKAAPEKTGRCKPGMFEKLLCSSALKKVRTWREGKKGNIVNKT